MQYVGNGVWILDRHCASLEHYKYKMALHGLQDMNDALLNYSVLIIIVSIPSFGKGLALIIGAVYLTSD